MDMMTDLQSKVAALRADVDALRRSGPVRITATASATKDIPVAVTGTYGGTTTSDNSTSATSANDTELTDHDVSGQDHQPLTPGMVKAPWERLELPDEKPDTHEDQPAGIGLTVVPTPAAPADDLPGWSAGTPDTRPKPAGVLWVDDNPSHNALQLDQLERLGVVVDTARSTREAIQKLTGQRYQVIVSDMERIESGKPVPNAGLELVRTVRTFDRDTPVVIYGSGRAGKALADTATQIGADLVTGSWYELSEELHRIGVL
jgi:CheY-like chemotaxis protein